MSLVLIDMRSIAISFVLSIILLLIPFQSYGLTVRNYTSWYNTEYFNKYLDKLPDVGYNGEIIILEEIPLSEYDSSDGFVASGVYYYDNYKILISAYDLGIIFHEMAHYIYDTTEWNMDIAKEFTLLRNSIQISPHYSNLNRYYYDGEIFACLTRDYYEGKLDPDVASQYEKLLTEILKTRRTS